MRKILPILVMILLSSLTLAQAPVKKVSAIRISEAPKIDGILNESIWQTLPVLDNFYGYYPYNDRLGSHPTEARVAYDDNALYIAAMLYDDPDSITQALGKRDSGDGINTDLFTVHLSPYNDRMNSYFFMIAVSGAQTDILISPNNQDGSWNAVWESSTKINNDGWSVEIRIPYSAIRFSDEKVQDWGFNLMRHIKRYNEWSTWSFINRESGQWYTHMGELTGLENLQPPLRLSFVPYLSGYLENNTTNQWGYSYNGGLDMKYGINESYTLDLTLIPDFGHVQSDDRELNLSPYEIQYDEKRQFFIEGTEMFQKAGIFYSRRVGSKPVFYDNVGDDLAANEKVIDNSTETQLINATKVSGRNRKGLGIGVFNAMTAKSSATIKDTLTGTERSFVTQPFTNYNILVLDQTFRKYSYASVINTNVRRGTYTANVSGTEFRFADKENMYNLWSQLAVNQKFDTDTTFKKGFKNYIYFGKVSGNFQYNYQFSVESDDYDPNDLGYIQQNNKFEHWASIEYNIFKPFGRFLELYQQLSFSHSSLYVPLKFRGYNIDYAINTNFTNNWYAEMHASWRPEEYRDYFESRVNGRVFRTPPLFHNCGGFQTDRKKPVSIELFGGLNRPYNDSYNRFSYWLHFEPRFQFNTNFILETGIYYSNSYNEIGYVDREDDDSRIYFGKRTVQTFETEIDLEYIFTSKMALEFRLRHYLSKADYNRYYNLLESGYVEPLDSYTENHDINYNAFNVDMVFTWNFAPGSELLLIYKNTIDAENEWVDRTFGRNLSDTIDSPQVNSLSVKVLYYLDYLTLKNRRTH
ncbi:MAG: DUF5916 domain-containing protein [bacterium]